MIEYDTFIYLDVYRTGSTHIINLLDRIYDGMPIQTFRHASLTKGRPLGFTGGKTVFTTVRNPWDWYVSLWAYGSDGKSAIRRHLLPHLGARELDALYDASEPRAAFGRWLRFMNDPAQLNRVMQEHLPQSGLASIIGLYSYRFLRVTTRYPRFLLRYPLIRNPAGAASHHRMFRAYDTVLRNETLDADLIAFVEKHPERFRRGAADMIRAAGTMPSNASSRSKASYRDYYTDSSAALVADRDSLFITTFDYRF
jgi:hypothetical protein